MRQRLHPEIIPIPDGMTASGRSRGRSWLERDLYGIPATAGEALMRRLHLLIVIIALAAAGLACSVVDRLVEPEVGEITDAVITAIVEGQANAANTPASPLATPTVAPPSAAPPTPTPTPVLRISYVEAGNVWLIEGPGAPSQLTTSANTVSVRISQDGEKIAHIRTVGPHQHGELWVVNRDGSGETLLISAADLDSLYAPMTGILGHDIGQMAFRPGTHELYFCTMGIPETIGLYKSDDLFRVDTDTGSLTPILPAGQGGDFSIAPDGSQIAIIQPDRLGLVDADGSNLRPDLITYPFVLTYSEYQYYPSVRWAEDSSRLGVVIPSDDPLAPSPNGTIWVLPADGTPATALSTINGDFFFIRPSSGTLLSPALNQVIFSRMASPGAPRELYIANVDGSAEQLIAPDMLTFTGWSPNNHTFVFNSVNPMDQYIAARDRAPTHLVTGLNFRWVGGTRYLVLSGSMGSWDLRMGILGGSATTLASITSDFGAYDFAE